MSSPVRLADGMDLIVGLYRQPMGYQTLELIFEFLEVRDLETMNEVSNEWHHIVDDWALGKWDSLPQQLPEDCISYRLSA